MASTKTNERPGTRAQASYVRGSASKTREVLNQIRGKSCNEAREILAFSERDAAQSIGKVLESAVANAEHNDGLDGDELYVSACYADEGPMLKRWRPRARGRATQILKRTCHITVIVSRYDPETLDRLRSQPSRSGVRSSDARRRRVARSRAAAAAEPDKAAGDPVPVAEPDVETRAADVVRATEEVLAGSPESPPDESSDDSEAGT